MAQLAQVIPLIGNVILSSDIFRNLIVVSGLCGKNYLSETFCCFQMIDYFLLKIEYFKESYQFY
jgi:hypothetical protein